MTSVCSAVMSYCLWNPHQCHLGFRHAGVLRFSPEIPPKTALIIRNVSSMSKLLLGCHAALVFQPWIRHRTEFRLKNQASVVLQMTLVATFIKINVKRDFND